MNSNQLVHEVLKIADPENGGYAPKVYTVDDRGHTVPVTGVKVQVLRDSEGDTPIVIIERDIEKPQQGVTQ